MSTPHPHVVVPPEQNLAGRTSPRECPTASVAPRATRPATRTHRGDAPLTRRARRVTDPRDATDIDFDEVNNGSTTPSTPCSRSESPPADDGERGRIVAESLDYVKGAGAGNPRLPRA